MKKLPEGNAIVYCEGAFNTPNGKTAHGLVRFTKRYKVICVIDSRWKGCDAGSTLDGKVNGIPVLAGLDEAVNYAKESGITPTHFVIGLAPDGGRLNNAARAEVKNALGRGLNVDSGLHDFLSDDPEISEIAEINKLKIRDIRKTPPRDKLHFFTGEIEKVTAYVIAVLGTDSAIGKRTTAWLIVNGLINAGYKAELVGTGQTAWMQGAKYSMIMDSLINDFVSGEIEHAVCSAQNNEQPDFIIIEGQGSLMNPAYPGGFEILAAGRPDSVVLQHAPARKEYDGFPGYVIHPLERQINAIECISDKKVIAITINHEEMTPEMVNAECKFISDKLNVPAFDVLLNGSEDLCALLIKQKNNFNKNKQVDN